jgi:hypothetical protein
VKTTRYKRTKYRVILIMKCFIKKDILMHTKIITALKKILVQADFKSAEKKFLETAIPEYAPMIKDYLNKFKKLRDSHKIHQTQNKDIDFWAKKGFSEFKVFVDQTSNIKSKSKVKKDIHKVAQKIPGAHLVAENEHWLIYEILAYKAAKLLGSRNWCIVREEKHWEDYTSGYPTSAFYFVLAKDRPDDEWNKIAVTINSDGDESCFNNLDTENDWDAVKKDLGNIPDFKLVEPDALCEGCKHSKDECTCCSICGGDKEDCNCCYQCESTEDHCTCCYECGSSDKSRCGCWCNNCNELVDDCNCCSYCDSENKDKCGCCQECGDGDKTKCGCWCPECDALIRNNYRDCKCDRCSDCDKLMDGPPSDNCECERCKECKKLVEECTCEKKEG